jgi:ABC-2 type transport system ATP-binding protein
VLLLDEPTSGLDPLGVRDARAWIEAARARGATVLVSSHVLSEVERTCDHVVILREGRVVASGALEALVQPGESLEDLFVRAVGGSAAPPTAPRREDGA